MLSVEGRLECVATIEGFQDSPGDAAPDSEGVSTSELPSWSEGINYLERSVSARK